MKLLILLNYEVVTAAPFVWQSPLTRQIVDSFSSLIEARLVGFMGRPGIKSAEEYLAERQYDTQKIPNLGLPAKSAFSSEVPCPSARSHALALDGISSLLPRRGSVEGTFKRMLIDDLGFDYSTGSIRERIMKGLPTKFSGTARRNAEKLIGELAALPFMGHFSRATLEARLFAHNLNLEMISDINLRSTGLYHAANAFASNAKLFTLMSFARALPSEIDFAHQFSLSPINPYLFLRVLNIFGISTQIIDNLQLNVLQRLATNAPEVRSFVDWYKSFLAECVQFDPNLASSERDAELLLNKIVKGREMTLRSLSRFNQIIRARRYKIELFIGLLGALVSLKLGLGFFGAGLRVPVKFAFDTLRKKCEYAIKKPLGDFEALVIREGLRGSILRNK